jgi:hypothetical protein
LAGNWKPLTRVVESAALAENGNALAAKAPAASPPI